MFTIKRFKEGPDIYHFDWVSHLPKTMTIIQRDKKIKYQLGNVMKHFDMVQVTYESNIWGFASTLEFDFYFLKIFGQDNFKIDVDITIGDAMVCEFSLKPPNKIDVIEYTSLNSKTDPSNTVFALEDESLKEFVDFLNLFTGFYLKVEHFKFLDKYDNYHPK